jgi:hypothetical protein
LREIVPVDLPDGGCARIARPSTVRLAASAVLAEDANQRKRA